VRIELEGLDEFQKKINPTTLLGPAFRRSHEQSITLLEGATKAGTPVDTGTARRDISHATDTASIPLWSQVGGNVKYLPPLEYGRKPGNPPRVEYLKPWAKRKGIPEEALFAIVRSIARKGTKGRFMFKKAFERNVENVKRIFDHNLKQVEKDFHR